MSLKQQGIIQFSFVLDDLSQIFTPLLEMIDHQQSTSITKGPSIKRIMLDSPHKNFLCLNGLIFQSINLNLLLKSRTSEYALVLSYRHNQNPRTTNHSIIVIDENYFIRQIQEKNKAQEDCFISSGIFLLPKKIIDFLQEDMKYLDMDIFSNLLKSAEFSFLLSGIPMGGNLFNLLQPTESAFSQEVNARRPCLFLDRDGIIIKDQKYLKEVKDIELIEEIVPIMEWARNRNFYIIALTNQSGIGRGLFTEEDYENITKSINQILKNRGIQIDRWYHSPYHPTEVKKSHCQEILCRKPDPGMALKAMEEFPIDIENSLMIGDKVSDILKLPGLKTYLIQGDYPLNNVQDASIIFSDHQELLKHLLKNFS